MSYDNNSDNANDSLWTYDSISNAIENLEADIRGVNEEMRSIRLTIDDDGDIIMQKTERLYKLLQHEATMGDQLDKMKQVRDNLAPQFQHVEEWYRQCNCGEGMAW